ncbi:polysaccharide biosynthesis protein [Treponema pedis]|uniref:polysaccharide biosynthesis protein n=1 Tax=Treponema pedis TaxID=409322 RepID=UPI001981002B|nr:nucleoside-diphosphate sugar epimerase/dehydratase [Treponema pedis]QSI05642.1 polysaccharide biosynthesis protein [Treponema pedis]
MTNLPIKQNPSIYIVGAGFAGTAIAKEISSKEIFGKVSAFLDDDPKKIGTKIDGVPVLGSISEAVRLIRIDSGAEALIAIPSISSERLREIFGILKNAGFSRIKLLPAISQIIDGSAHLVQARDIDPQDLLSRTPVKISLKKSLAYLRGKRVLITGAGGSIGSELARQLLSGGAERLYLFGHGENSIYQIHKELKLLQSGGVGDKATIVPIIGELKDRNYMRYIINRLKCDAVFHTAAYKHVPLMEENPVAVIENNVFGTKNLLDACLEFGVKKFVLISTDKAVEPVSAYGLSKMLNEKSVLQAAEKAKNSNENSAYMFVRFGNVLGSRGSIFPLFVEQIKTGGPVTVTDKKMTRYFMTIPEACSLVLQTGGVGKSGQSYLLDMGEPVNIFETAKQLIRYMGFEPEKDIKIEIIGVREGERLEEPLWSKSEYLEKTDYEKIMLLKDSVPFDSDRLNYLLEKLAPFCFYTEGKEDLFRNKDKMKNFIRNEGLVL